MSCTASAACHHCTPQIAFAPPPLPHAQPHQARAHSVGPMPAASPAAFPTSCCPLSPGGPLPTCGLPATGFMKHRPTKKEQLDCEERFAGTPDFASDHALQERCSGPIDDIIGLGYTLLEMHAGGQGGLHGVPLCCEAAVPAICARAGRLACMQCNLLPAVA